MYVKLCKTSSKFILQPVSKRALVKKLCRLLVNLSYNSPSPSSLLRNEVFHSKITCCYSLKLVRKE